MQALRAVAASARSQINEILVRFSVSLCAVGVLATIAVILYAGSPSDPEWWETTVFFLPWMLWPYALLAATALWSRRNSGGGAAVAIAVASVCAVAGYIFLKAFVIELDPQSCVAAFLLPALQAVIILAVGSATIMLVSLLAGVRMMRGKGKKGNQAE